MSGPTSVMAGKVTGGEGRVLATWRLGDGVLHTGFDPRAKADCGTLIDEVDALLTERATT